MLAILFAIPAWIKILVASASIGGLIFLGIFRRDSGCRYEEDELYYFFLEFGRFRVAAVIGAIVSVLSFIALYMIFIWM